MNNTLRELLRLESGRQTQPTGGSMNSQSTKTTEEGEQGVDGGNKVNGRKQRILVELSDY